MIAMRLLHEIFKELALARAPFICQMALMSQLLYFRQYYTTHTKIHCAAASVLKFTVDNNFKIPLINILWIKNSSQLMKMRGSIK